MDKRQQLIRTAFELFYKEGIHAVGINQILQVSGIAKKTLYHHFETKEALVAAVIEYRDKTFYDWLEQRVSRAQAGEGGIMAIFAALDDWINDRAIGLTTFHGCFFINACAEYGDPKELVHQFSAQHKRRIRGLITDQVSALGMDDKRREFIVDTICLLKEGAIVQAHVTGDYMAALKAARTIQHLLHT